jgi:hypothetical protein
LIFVPGVSGAPALLAGAGMS